MYVRFFFLIYNVISMISFTINGFVTTHWNVFYLECILDVIKIYDLIQFVKETEEILRFRQKYMEYNVYLCF